MSSVRLDTWLDVACLYKTRSEAQKACKLGKIAINGSAAKPHRDVKVGDELVISRPMGRRQLVTVLGLAETHVARAEARLLYEDRTPKPTPQEIEIRRMKLARFDELPRVIAGIDAAVDTFPGFKMDTVIIRGVNDDEIIPLLEFAKSRGAEIRFIEYMDVGGATNWSMSQVVSRQEMLATIAAQYGTIEPLREATSAPADRYRLPDGTVFGIIASTTEPFCRSCDRSRLTADGVWYLCLYAARGVDLRGPLRGGVSDEALRDLITSVWHARTDRGAENRLDMRERSPLIPLKALKKDPHLEMHTRGG